MITFEKFLVCRKNIMSSQLIKEGQRSNHRGKLEISMGGVTSTITLISTTVIDNTKAPLPVNF